MIQTIELELDNGDVVCEEQGFFTVSAIVADITYHIETIIDADTPLGPKTVDTIVIDDIEGTVYKADQDGGESEYCDDVLSWITEDDILAELALLV